MRYFIQLAYNGKNYHGWQKQINAHSVQTEIESKLEILLKEKIELVGCGRTDTGVHAKQFYAHFDSEINADEAKICRHLNAMLPKDIVIRQIFPVQPEHHARFSATYREYEYWISTEPTPFLNELSSLFIKPPDVDAMNNAALLLLIQTDFECFSKVHTDVNTFNCKVTKAVWENRENNMLVFTIRADRFLRNMVRAIVGTLLDIGYHKTDEEKFEKILSGKKRSEAGFSVPAHGLFLTRVGYDFITS
ncbi:MAG: tRNA pseudouridine(38-40) synthase TruA [Bacteroidia bacterium]|nr:tRNA pseudouridine(38-40) synthase TruA [Bacteroidia bacterium]